MSRNVTLHGGPADGRTVSSFAGATGILIPEAIPPKRVATEHDQFEVYPDGGFCRWVDDDCNVHFVKHQYDGHGNYVGVMA